MKESSKKILIFIIVMILIIGFANIVYRIVLPVKPVRLISSSMEPTYSKGDVLFYEEPSELELNDVIIYETCKNPSVVRIIKINDDGFTVKGDNNDISIDTKCFDELNVEKHEIIGRVLFKTSGWLFYIVSYLIQIIIAIILTHLIYTKIKS